MKSTFLLLCYIATRLTPTVLDLVVQTTNAVVVNGMQTVLMCVAVDSQTCILRICFYIDAEFHYPTPLCCIPEGRAGNRTITNPGEHLKRKKIL